MQRHLLQQTIALTTGASFMFLVVTIMAAAFGFTGSARSCSEVVEIQFNGTADNTLKYYVAILKFPTPKAAKGRWMLTMKLTNPFKLVSAYSLSVSTSWEKEAQFVNFHEQGPNGSGTRKGTAISFPIYVGWDPQQSMPCVEEMVWEGEQICREASLAT